MNWIEKNILYIVYGFLAMVILFQMWYIWEIKTQLRAFNEKEHIVIEVIQLEGKRYSDTVRIKCDSNRNRVIKKSIDKF